MEYNNLSLGLRQLIQEHGISVREMCKSGHMHYGTILTALYRKQKHSMRLDTLFTIAEILDMKPSELLEKLGY